MPKKTAVNPMGYQQAVSMFGKEAVSALAHTPQTLSTWKGRGIPADVVLPLVLDLLKQRGGIVREEVRYESAPPGVDPNAWSEIRNLLPRLSLIYEAQDIEAHTKRWEWITGNLETFSDMVRADVEELRQRRRKARNAG